MLSYIFIFQRALNLSAKKLNKQNKKKKGQRLKIVDYFFFAGNILYYTDFILIIIKPVFVLKMCLIFWGRRGDFRNQKAGGDGCVVLISCKCSSGHYALIF